MEPRVEIRARPAYVVLVVICAAVGIGILFLAGMGLMAARDAATGSEPPPLLLPVFIGLEAACVAAARVVRRRFVTPTMRPVGRPDSAARLFVVPDLDETLERIRVGIIVACALSEVPAILGLVYLIMGGDVVWAPVFFGGALISWALTFPRPSEWEEWLADVAAPAAPRLHLVEDGETGKTEPPSPDTPGDGPERVH